MSLYNGQQSFQVCPWMYSRELVDIEKQLCCRSRGPHLNIGEHISIVYLNFSSSNSPIDVQPKAIIEILHSSVIQQKDSLRAISQMLELASLKKFVESLKTDNEVKDFHRHMRKYYCWHISLAQS
jgi:hypothetical protein